MLYCYMCCSVIICVVLCIVCTVPLPPGVNPIAVDRYINNINIKIKDLRRLFNQTCKRIVLSVTIEVLAEAYT